MSAPVSVSAFATTIFRISSGAARFYGRLRTSHITQAAAGLLILFTVGHICIA